MAEGRGSLRMLIYSLLTLIVCGLGFFVRGRRQGMRSGFPRSSHGADDQGARGGFSHPLPEPRDGFRNGVCLIGIFLLLFLLSAFRVGIGNDYYKYVEFINRITFDSYVPTEWGFNTLVKLSNLLFGPENFFAVFALMAAFTLPLFLFAFYLESADFGISLYLFMTFGFYFQTLNTIRYYLALGIILLALRFIIGVRRSDLFMFILSALIAALFHKSALIAIPFYLTVLLLARAGKRLPLFLGLLTGLSALIGFSALFFRDEWLRLVVLLYPSYENVGPLEGGTSYAGILRCLLTLGLGLYALLRSPAPAEPARSRMSSGKLSGSGSVSETSSPRGMSSGKLSGSGLMSETSSPCGMSFGELPVESSGSRSVKTEPARSGMSSEKPSGASAPCGMSLKEKLIRGSDSRLGFYLLAAFLTLLLYLFFSFLPQISRLAYYGSVLQLLAIPEALALLRQTDQERTVFARSAEATGETAAHLRLAEATAENTIHLQSAEATGETAAHLHTAEATAENTIHLRSAEASPRPADSSDHRAIPAETGCSRSPVIRIGFRDVLCGVLLFGLVYFGLFLREAGSEELGLLPYRSILFEEPRSYEGTWE